MEPQAIFKCMSIYRCMCKFYLQIACLFIDASLLLLSLNISWTINYILFSMSTWKQLTEVANQLAKGISSQVVGWWDMQVDLFVTE